MSIATVVTEGFGSFGSIGAIVTQGFTQPNVQPDGKFAYNATGAFGAYSATGSFGDYSLSGRAP